MASATRCGPIARSMVRRLGDPLQIEDFDEHDTVFFILADGTDGELTVTDVGAHAAVQPRAASGHP